MKALRALTGLLVLTLVASCGDSSSSTPTTPAPSPVATTFTLTGSVTDEGGQALSAVAVTALDGPNANRDDRRQRQVQHGRPVGGWFHRAFPADRL